MATTLRAVAVVVGLAVVVTAAQVVQFAGRLGTLLQSGALGVSTLIAWPLILTVGPVAAIQLFRLRRIGLVAATLLCGVAFAYYIAGLLFLRTPEAPIQPLIAACVINGAFLAVLLLPAARRRVS